MKSRIFIGSSSEALTVATAIHAGLDRDAECTVWTQQVFSLGANAVQSLTRQAEESDFAIFVFAPDDQATVRGQLFTVPRDNVVYELGLFSGVLGPQRCFFVTPRGSTIHLPTDLAGITAGDYDAKRSDKNLQAAAGPFCGKVRIKLGTLGLSSAKIPKELRELAVKFECCDWITDMQARVKAKEGVVSQMIAFLSNRSVNKNVLLEARRVGFNAALAAAIIANPESGDDNTLLKVRADLIPRGIAQHVMVNAIDALDRGGRISTGGRLTLVQWAESFRDQDPSLSPRINAIKTR